VVRDYTGHGIGKQMHEDPQIKNYGDAGKGVKLMKGMALAIEPMINEGTYETGRLPTIGRSLRRTENCLRIMRIR
jgi:methionyl aminopeptidase